MLGEFRSGITSITISKRHQRQIVSSDGRWFAGSTGESFHGLSVACCSFLSSTRVERQQNRGIPFVPVPGIVEAVVNVLCDRCI